jgi:hypothetical protein
VHDRKDQQEAELRDQLVAAVEANRRIAAIRRREKRKENRGYLIGILLFLAILAFIVIGAMSL